MTYIVSSGALNSTHSLTTEVNVVRSENATLAQAKPPETQQTGVASSLPKIQSGKNHQNNWIRLINCVDQLTWRHFLRWKS